MKENQNKDNILFYFVLFCFIVSILLGLVILITDFMKSPIPNYLKYGFKTTEVAKIYQKEYVPEIQEYIQKILKRDMIRKKKKISIDYSKQPIFLFVLINFSNPEMILNVSQKLLIEIFWNMACLLNKLGEWIVFSYFCCIIIL
mgnify:FL=1